MGLSAIEMSDDDIFEPVKILLLEDSASDAEREEDALRKAGMHFQSRRVETRSAFISALDAFCPDLILSDCDVAGFEARAALDMVRASRPDLPFILVTAALGEESAVELIKAGLTDYVLKDRLGRLPPAVNRALHGAEQLLRRRRHEASRDELSQIVESAEDAVVGADLFGIVTVWNKAAARLFGRSASEAIGSAIAEVFPTIQQIDCRTLLEQAKQGAAEPRCEIRLLDVAGMQLHVLLMFSPIHDPAGGIRGISVVGRDITELSVARERLEDASHYARSLIEASLDPLLVVTLNGIITDANDAASQMIGLGRQHIVGTELAQYFGDPDAVRESCARAAAEGHVRGYQLAVRHVSGRTTDVLYNASLFRNRAGQVAGIVASARDISERKAHERLKDEFLSIVSHEMRTPLTSISASLGLLVGTAAAALPKDALRLVTIAHDNSQRLVRLINDILDFEKLQAGKVSFILEDVNVRDVVAQAAEANSPLAASRAVRISVGGASGAPVRADPDRLMQVLSNLLSNAIKFSPPDGEVQVEVDPSAGDHIKVSVIDHGPGVPDSFRAHLFEPFRQAGRSPSGLPGTGLGLSIVKQIAVRLGGEVSFAATPGGGATFCLELPCISSVPPSGSTSDLGRGSGLPRPSPTQELTSA